MKRRSERWRPKQHASRERKHRRSRGRRHHRRARPTAVHKLLPGRGRTAPIRLRPISWAGWPTERSRCPRAIVERQSSLKRQAVKDFETLTTSARQRPRRRKPCVSGRDAYEEEAPQYPAEEPAASSQKFEPHLDSEDVNSVDYDTWQERDLELAYEPEEEQPERSSRCGIARSTAPADEYERTRPHSPTAAW